MAGASTEAAEPAITSIKPTPTPGPVTFTDGFILKDGEALRVVGVQIPMVVGAARLEAIVNSEFIAEAFNTLYETGLTPQQLREQRDELLAALKALVADIEDYERVNNLAPAPGKLHCWRSMQIARAALARSVERGEGTAPRRRIRADHRTLGCGACPADTVR